MVKGKILFSDGLWEQKTLLGHLEPFLIISGDTRPGNVSNLRRPPFPQREREGVEFNDVYASHGDAGIY